MNQFKRAQVIMLEVHYTKTTKYETEGTIELFSNKLSITGKVKPSNHPFVRGSTKQQHLYIISDDKIKEGDYFLADNRISTSSNNGNPNWVICKCTKVKNSWIYCNEIPDEGHNGNWCKKIIATTDTSLIINDWLKVKENNIQGEYEKSNYLPQPSQQFIEKYIEEYNKGNVIKDVLVELNQPVCKCDSSEKINKCCYSTGLEDCTAPNPNNDFYGLRVKINPKDNTIVIKEIKDSWSRKEVIENLITMHINLYGADKLALEKVNDWIEENL